MNSKMDSRNGLPPEADKAENGNKILGIWISIFLDFGFWRDFGFSPQKGFGDECGRLCIVLYNNIV